MNAFASGASPLNVAPEKSKPGCCTAERLFHHRYKGEKTLLPYVPAIQAVTLLFAHMPNMCHNDLACMMLTCSWNRSSSRRCLSASSSAALISCPAIADFQGLPCSGFADTVKLCSTMQLNTGMQGGSWTMSMTCPHAFKGEENTFSALHNCKCNVPSSARACPEFRLSMLSRDLTPML